ncbi:hypothetical protein [Streptomyces sp. NPDC057877]|uniref:hypothetical protein n=1 Tax=Streptomyces sp. NPDC057877 TaxID=3346269 RepID=UPI0036768354
MLSFLVTVLGVGAEQLMEWRFGPMGIVALLLLAVGLRSNNSTCACLGAVTLLLLLLQGQPPA